MNCYRAACGGIGYFKQGRIYCIFKEKTLILAFFLGLICSIGFYTLFYKLNRPVARWRSIALLSAVILSRPICLLWQSLYLEYGQNNSAILIGIAIILDVFSLLVCVFLGANSSCVFVPAAFVYSVISIVQIPVVYFVAIVVHPLIDTLSLFEIAAQFPQLYYSGLFFNNVLITICCFLAARWLRAPGPGPQGEGSPLAAQIKPPPKFIVFFSLLFILFALIVLLWWSDILKIMSMSFLPSALLGTLLFGILLFLFYVYTRLTTVTFTAGIKDKESPLTCEYAQFIPHLSKRELEVIEAILAGNDSYKKLTATLHISINTVKTHLKHIYQTTGVSNLTALSTLFRGYSSGHP